jgi:hypothetical protein
MKIKGKCAFCRGYFKYYPSAVGKFCSNFCQKKGRYRPDIRTRFFKSFNVDKKTGCWVSKRKDWYGQFSLNGKPILAHRISWQIHYGKIKKGFCILHECDNPPCVNPLHLSIGDKKKNNKDAIDRGLNFRDPITGKFITLATRQKNQGLA